ncbi:MAG: NAD(P)-binding domain-containing protein [Deltaproteobacteria bacterium]|nr:NAD(P)-binding domain-containing protein [Deltaproteobacteria bacterium]
MAHARLVERYKRDPIASLRDNPAVALPARALETLGARAEFVDLLPGERLSARLSKDRHKERYYMVAEGQVGVCRAYSEIDTDPLEVKVRKGKPGHDRELLAYLSTGEVFSDAYMLMSASGSGVDIAAIMETVLVAVDRHELAELMAKDPGVEEALRERIDRARSRIGSAREPARRVPQNFFLRHNYSFATTLKVIDLEACIGCDGCERACEERHGNARLVRKGPVLGRLAFPIACRTCVDHRCLPACGFDSISLDPNGEVRINQKTCVGCTACQSACPNGVIEMIETPYTVDDFPRPLPNTDNDGRTNVPGLYLVGEAAGSALIKLAINGGVKAIEAIATELAAEPKPSVPGVTDVIIVGAGPGGLSAALSCREKGLEFVAFDKGSFAMTIQTYPRKKLVMAEPAHIPLYGSLWMKDASKEEIIERWTEILTTTGLPIQSNEEVTSVTKGADGLFDVKTSKGAYRSRRVVMATGNRGSPRKLGVAGEAEPRVQYQLTEPEDFAKKHVIVVGGGDSAVEGAMSLAEIRGTTVTLSYRQDKFGRIKAKNKERLDEFQRDKKLEVILSSKVKALEPDAAVLETPEGTRKIPNDFIFAMLGAEPPTKFFQGAGIEILEPGTEKMAALATSRGNRFFANKCDHCAGHDDQACITACPTDAIFELQPSEVFVDPSNPEGRIDETRFREGLERAGHTGLKRALPYILSALALATVGLGLECFLRAVMPENSVAALILGTIEGVSFESGRGLGFYLGIAGLAAMAITSGYPLNSRLGWLRSVAKTRIWLVLHIALGFMGPALVTYHTRLKLDRWPTIAFLAMWAVVVSGMLGRFLYTWFRRSSGLAELESLEIDHSRFKAMEDAKGMAGRTRVFAMSEGAGEQIIGLLAPIALLWHQLTTFTRGLRLRFIDLRDVDDPLLRRRALELFRKRARNQRSRLFLGTAEKSAAVWRRIHLLATLALFVVAALHVVVALMYRTT